MVQSITKTNRNAAAASGANLVSLEASEKALKTLTATTNEKVAGAIKARIDSAKLLYSAAAYSFFLGIVYGRWEQANELFTKLPAIDSNALRTLFAARVNDKYAVDGVHDVDADEKPLATWIKRPTTMIIYNANPATKGQHFSLAKAEGDGETAKAKRVLIEAYREKVKAAGVEDLEAIIWIKRETVNNAPSTYDLSNFQDNLVKLLTKAAKATGDDESRINIAMIESIMREANMPKAKRVEVRDAYTAESSDKPPVKKPEAETMTDETKPANQVAA